MFHRLFHPIMRTNHIFIQKMSAPFALQAVAEAPSAKPIDAPSHPALTIVCLLAFLLLGAILAKPSLADQIMAHLSLTQPIVITLDSTVTEMNKSDMAASIAESNAPTGDSDQTKNGLPDHQEKGLRESKMQQQLVTYWISKRYHVAGEAADMFVKTSYSTAKDLKLDPLLILAVIAIESRFNPFSESAMGAQGLMQIMPKIHQEKFEPLGGIRAALNPAVNIRVGALILKEYVSRGGSLEAGLKSYVGAAEEDTDSGYGEKVLEEYRRLKEVATGKRVPLFTTTASSGGQKLPALIEQKLLDTPKKAEPSSTAQPPEAQILKNDQVVATL